MASSTKTKGPSLKRVLIDKTNSSIVIVTSIAAFVVVFSLISTKGLLSQASYQNKVIGKQKTTLRQLTSDVTAADNLSSSYKAFTGTTTNVIGGISSGNGEQDGNNADIVLDALPSSYDFPALTSSLEALLTKSGVQINSINGSDDEVAQSNNTSSTAPKPVAMPFQVSVSGSYDSIQALVSNLEHSIRPMQIQTMQLSGDQKQLTMSISAQTFYQTAKSLNITKQVVK